MYKQSKQFEGHTASTQLTGLLRLCMLGAALIMLGACSPPADNYANDRAQVMALIARTAAAPYVKVVLRLRPAAATAWTSLGESLFTVLTDGPAGSVYLRDPDGNQIAVVQSAESNS